MLFLRKYKFPILLFFLFTVIYFVSRIYHILSLPIFTDEAIYIRWSQIAKSDANWRFISLTDGKQPLFVWLTMIFMKFVKDPLLSGRLVSLVAGFFSMVGLFFLGREIFKNFWIGLTSSFLYLIYPMSLVYDKMALYDGLVASLFIWSLFLVVLLIRKVRLDVALLLGIVTGAGVLTKSTNFFSIYLLPLSLLLFNWKKNSLPKLVKWTGLAVLSVFISYTLYSILRLSPFFHIINDKNSIFVYPVKEWLTHPLTFLWGNFSVGEWNWLSTYLTLPLLALVVFPFFFYKEFLREKIFLFAWFFIPFFALALFGKVLYPRFIFFMTLALLPLIAYSLFKIRFLAKSSLTFSLILLFFLSFPIYSDIRILSDFSKSPIPKSDLNQYNNDWPSGGGIKEAVTFFQDKARGQKIKIITQGTFGLLPYGLEIYLVDNPNIKIEGIWPITYKLPDEIIKEGKKVSTYFVFYQPCADCGNSDEVIGLAPASWTALNLVYQYSKPRSGRYLSIYQIKP